MNELKKPSKADKLIFKALKKAVDEDKLRIYLDYGKINRPSSPVYDPWECLLPILIPVLIGLVLILSVGVFFGLSFIVAITFIYSTYFKKKTHRHLIERTKKHLVESYNNCETLWNFGGIILVNAENKKQGCVAPEGDWKEFVVKNFSDFMIDNQEKEAPKDEQETTAAE